MPKLNAIVIEVEKRKHRGEASMSRKGAPLGVGVFLSGLEALGIKPPNRRSYRVLYILDDAGPFRVFAGYLERCDGPGFYPLCIFPADWTGHRVRREVLR